MDQFIMHEIPNNRMISEIYVYPHNEATHAPQFSISLWYTTPRQSMVVKNLPKGCSGVDLFNVFSKMGWITHIEIEHQKTAYVYFDYWYFTPESMNLRDEMMKCFPREYKMPGNKLLISPNTDPQLVYQPIILG
jgi:hypothetical protein